jgi:hypothetical protein
VPVASQQIIHYPKKTKAPSPREPEAFIHHPQRRVGCWFGVAQEHSTTQLQRLRLQAKPCERSVALRGGSRPGRVIRRRRWSGGSRLLCEASHSSLNRSVLNPSSKVPSSVEAATQGHNVVSRSLLLRGGGQCPLYRNSWSDNRTGYCQVNERSRRYLSLPT